ncbi:MAG: hypothetical protein WHU10_02685 [Fimbriimonadales bacterium]
MRFGRKGPMELGDGWGADDLGSKVRLGIEALREQRIEPGIGIEAVKGRILEETLVAPRRPAWVWATPAAAALALAFWLGASVRPSAVVAPSLDRAIDSGQRTVAHKVPTARPHVEAATSLAAPVEPSQPKTVQTVDAPAGPVAVRSEPEGGPLVVAQSSPMLASEAGTDRQSAPPVEQGAPATPDEPPVASSVVEEQIVLIHSTEDAETGAAAAVELESSANVLVGG